MQNGGKDMIQPKLSYTAGGSINPLGTTTWEKSSVVSYNTCLHTFCHIMNQQLQFQVFALEK